MEIICLQELLKATGGQLLGDVTDLNTQITGIQSDNRKIEEGNLFVAFVGENTDGHKYVKAALEAGAAGALISSDPGEYVPGKFYVLVKDTILAVGDLAAYYRSKFTMPVVGITGSVGKTTTKDMIAAVLSAKFNVLKTEANFNNNIGLPRTIFRLNKEVEIAVIEMGMNHSGEITYLTNIAKPDLVTITNVGEAHIGNLGSKENIFLAKCEIFDGLADGGHAVMNGDDAYLVRLRKDSDKQAKYTFDWVGESKDCTFRAVKIQDTLEECVKFQAVTPQGTYDLNVPALGHHMIYPVLTAAAIGTHFGMTPEEIERGVASYVASGNRMKAIALPGNITVYNDTYNANPQSMKAGLKTLSNKQGVRTVAVLGDMFELGDLEESLHREVGAFAAEVGIDTLIAVGAASAHLADEAKKHGLADVRICEDKEVAKEEIRKLYADNTAFFFKASHGMHLEELAAFTQALAEK